jgi:hypothetical protein
VPLGDVHVGDVRPVLEDHARERVQHAGLVERAHHQGEQGRPPVLSGILAHEHASPKKGDDGGLVSAWLILVGAASRLA